ncbi:MAG: hypothetical protein NTW19_11280 [Planctomycetota bacterium]|nr:hypothetical protein [Planctomycetota bacterium]
MDTLELNRHMAGTGTPELEAEFNRLRNEVGNKRQLIDDLRSELREQVRDLMYIEAELARRSDPSGSPRRRRAIDY